MNDSTKKILDKLTKNFSYKEQLEESFENIVEYINDCENEKNNALKKLEEFNKDEEILKLKETLNKSRKNSLLEMSDKEKLAEEEFRKIHYNKCKNGNRFSYELTGTGIGIIIKISCPICKEEKDITDTSSW